MERMRKGALALALVACPLAATAQEKAIADSKAAGDDEINTAKYFYFAKSGVSAATAAADYEECTEYGDNVQNIAAGSQTVYVPYTGNLSPLAAGLAGGVGGLVGGLLVEALFKGPQRRAMKRTILRKCMGFKGYQRYAISEERWKSLSDGDDRKAIYARFAALAIEPAPAGGALPL